jgi:hypothetical protein
VAEAVSSRVSAKEKLRQQLVWLVFLVYWMLIFEGAVRKWGLPELQKVLFFARDPVVLWIYYLCWKNNLLPRWRGLFKLFGILSAALLVLAVLQMFTGLEPFIGIYGWRNYCFYVPLAFIIADQFNEVDLARLVRRSLIVSIPIAAIVFMQYKSPPTAWINRSYVEDAHVFTVTGDIVRTTGTFTFSAGQALFVGSVIAMLFALWLSASRSRVMNLPLLILCSMAVVTNLALCGSRSAFFFAAMAFAGAMAYALVTKNKSAQIKTFLILPTLVLTGGLLFTTIFHTSFEAMVERSAKAEANEGSVVQRALRIVTASYEVLPEITVLGKGIGSGTTGASAITTSTVRQTFELHENEGARVFQEAGILGLVYMLARLALAVYILRGAVLATRRTNSPLPLLLASFAALIIAFAQTTLQGTTNGYGWLFAGFCMAANRIGSTKQKRPEKALSASGTHSIT